jgi:legume-like lectin family protein
LRLTDGGTNEARSAFFTTLVNVQSFTNDFSFQLSTPNGDGFTFTIQNTGLTALGSSGGGLGYGPDQPSKPPGIGKSVAVKFDLSGNAGEGTNSTGMYTNGASPTVPAIDLTSSGVNLHSGDVMNVHMTYDGTTLAMTITDATAGKSFTASWAVNIPSVVGASSAYAGFTAGTGSSTATQEILTWSYASGAPTTKVPIQYEPENLMNSSVSSGPTYRVFAWTGFTDGNGTILDATRVGDSVTITLNVPQAGTYDVKVAVKLVLSRGVMQLSVNGTNVGPAEDQYLSSNAWKEFDIGNVLVSSAGNQSFKFTVVGKNSSSSGYSISFDYIKLTPQ